MITIDPVSSKNNTAQWTKPINMPLFTAHSENQCCRSGKICPDPNLQIARIRILPKIKFKPPVHNRKFLLKNAPYSTKKIQIHNTGKNTV
jgi:hypothetical protein